MNILICSQSGEQQVDYVSDLVKAKGGTPILFERYRKDHFLTYSYDGSGASASLTIGEKSYPLRSDVFPVVWHRIKPIVSSELRGSKPNLREEFCVFEWSHALSALETFLEKSKWINPSYQSQKISKKAHQLKLALDCELTVPMTCITNKSSDVLPLYHHGDVIYKTLSSFCTKKDTIFTTEVKHSQIVNHPESIAMAPGIFQTRIKKEYELRVTVIENAIFIVKINSQKKRKTSVDWRRGPYEKMYERGALSEKVAKRLLDFHQKAGLVYAAYDFIVDTEGNEIFLECNPGGQWLWVERAADVGISDAFANALLKMK